MPSWKIKGYWCYFKTNELTIKNKPAHIHVETSHGEIQFWLETIDIKKIKGQVSQDEQNKIAKLVQENKDLFLKEWKKRKELIKVK